jgi:glycosyltransferase involved in cell wall biosynthesis
VEQATILTAQKSGTYESATRVSLRPPTRLIAFVPKPVGLAPGQRFRLEQWAPALAHEHGIDLDFVPFESARLTEMIYAPGHQVEKAYWLLRDTLRRYGAVRAARAYDGAVIYREMAMIGPAIYERLLARAGIPFYFDFDDAIWMQPPGGVNGAFARLHFWGKTKTTCRLARGVAVGNGYLADFARRYNPSTFIVPTSIDLTRYPVQPELPYEDPFVIVWSGSTHTLAHLEHARPILERLGARRRVTLRIICNHPPERPIAHVKNEFIPWNHETEARDLGAAHVGIMPLPDDRFTRGKCALKGLQYMATGRPAVMSPVGVNVDVVRSGENGILASSAEEWDAALEKLASSPDLRRRLGEAGRLTVEQRYATPVAARLFADMVAKTLPRQIPSSG